MEHFSYICDQFENHIFMREPFNNNRQITYGDLRKYSFSLANKLKSMGIKANDYVILNFNNRIEYSVSHFALLIIGATAVTLPMSGKAEDLDYIMKLVQPKLILASDNKSDLYAEWNEKWLAVEIEKLEQFPSEEFDEYKYERDDVAALLFTSGTTGKPKGVMIKYVSAVYNFIEYGNALKFDTNTKIIQCLPVEHADGWCFSVLFPFLFGASVILTPAYNAQVALNFERLVNDGGNILVCVPSILTSLLEMKNRYQLPFKGKLKSVLCSSSKLHVEVVDNFEKEFDTNILEFYGSTEALLIAYYTEQINFKTGSVGKVSPQVSIDFTEEGEILVKSPFLFKGYFLDQKRTSQVMQDEWYKTGDIGTVDEEGYLFLLGRKQYFINKAGKKIDPSDIDSVVVKLDSVKESVTLGIEDKLYGEQIYTFIVLNYPQEVEKISLYLKQNLQSEYWPKEIIVVEQIPYNSIGKVERKKLEINVIQLK